MAMTNEEFWKRYKALEENIERHRIEKEKKEAKYYESSTESTIMAWVINLITVPFCIWSNFTWARELPLPWLPTMDYILESDLGSGKIFICPFTIGAMLIFYFYIGIVSHFCDMATEIYVTWKRWLWYLGIFILAPVFTILFCQYLIVPYGIIMFFVTLPLQPIFLIFILIFD